MTANHHGRNTTDVCIKIRNRGDRARTLENLRPYRSGIGEGDNGSVGPVVVVMVVGRSSNPSPPSFSTVARPILDRFRPTEFHPPFPHPSPSLVDRNLSYTPATNILVSVVSYRPPSSRYFQLCPVKDVLDRLASSSRTKGSKRMNGRKGEAWRWGGGIREDKKRKEKKVEGGGGGGGGSTPR